MAALYDFPEGGIVKADLEDGFLKLSNTLIRQLMTTQLSGNEQWYSNYRTFKYGIRI